MSELYMRGSLVKYWPGIKGEGPTRYAHIISDGVVKSGGTDCVRIEKSYGGTDYIALSHVEVVA